MYRDEILTEVWRIRDGYAAEHGHDLKRIVADLEKRQAQSHGPLVDKRPNGRIETKADGTVRP
jgi:hypothetical protein